MAGRKKLAKGTWVFRPDQLLNDDQKLAARSVGRVSGHDGALTTVKWSGSPIPRRVPVPPDSLKYLDGQSASFDPVLVGVERIRREFLLIVRGDPPHLHSPAIHNLLNAVLGQLEPLCPRAARNVELAVKDFRDFCETREQRFADWFGQDLTDAVKALPWVWFQA